MDVIECTANNLASDHGLNRTVSKETYFFPQKSKKFFNCFKSVYQQRLEQININSLFGNDNYTDVFMNQFRKY